jgi:hypothetical protein
MRRLTQEAFAATIDGLMRVDALPILSLTSDAFIERARTISIKPGHALEVYRRVFREGVVDVGWVSMPSMPVAQQQNEGETTKFTQRLTRAGTVGIGTSDSAISHRLSAIGRQQSVESRQPKAASRMPQSFDSFLETESVILPQHSRTGRVRNTLCVSSQIGCAMGCEFCETAQMGLMRNLSVEEIVAQWFAARFSHVEVLHFKRMIFDVRAAAFHVFAHEHRE